MGDAIGYALGQWDALTLFLKTSTYDGQQR